MQYEFFGFTDWDVDLDWFKLNVNTGSLLPGKETSSVNVAAGIPNVFGASVKVSGTSPTNHSASGAITVWKFTIPVIGVGRGQDFHYRYNVFSGSGFIFISWKH